MIKYLECPDIHKDPERGDIWDIVRKSILSEAKRQQVDFVAFPGDFWKAVTTNGYKGGVVDAILFINELREICPVVAIEGTPSHDEPGSYGIFKDSGLVLLQPNKTYGFYRNESNQTFIEENGIDNWDPEAILFGVPELNKNEIQSQLSLSAEEGNALAVDLFNGYMDSYVGPMRMKYQDIPAFMLFHGNVSDSSQENSSDMIIRSSDIVIKSEAFRRANLTRVSLGHIHKPWESEVCNMGYSGSPGLKWGECGFIPSMTMVTYDPDFPDNKILERLPYGTPMRKKVYSLSEITPNPNIAYWLVTKDPEVKLPEGIHPWSRVTIDESNNKTTRRAAEKDIEKTRTLWDLALLLNPEVDPSLKEKFDLLQEKVVKESTEKVAVTLNRVEVYGCKFFSGDDAILDIDSLNPGLTSIGGSIKGKQNGIGKSGILSFCSPYPTVVGKDTKSGRSSALKDFFNKKDSKIVKYLTRNGVEHKHVITIKAAHTKSGGKVECNLSIDGESQLAKGTFDEMQALCESLYGSYQDYLLTSFYVQPLQGKTGSSLMSASMTTIRDLVQGIAGIDRSQEKRMALDFLAELNKSLDSVDSKIEFAESKIEPKEPILEELSELEGKIKELSQKITEGNAKGLQAKSELESLMVQKTENDKNKALLNDKKAELSKINSEINSIPKQIETAKSEIIDVEAANIKISNFEKNSKIIDKYNSDLKDYNHYIDKKRDLESRKSEAVVKLENMVIPDKSDLEERISSYTLQIKENNDWSIECESIKTQNSTIISEYNKAIQDYSIAKSNHDHEVSRVKTHIEQCSKDIENFKIIRDSKNQPCPKCDYLEPMLQDEIKIYDEKISKAEGIKKELEDKLSSLKFEQEEPKEPETTPLPDKPHNDYNLEHNLKVCEQSLSNRVILVNQKEDLEKQIETLKFDISKLVEVAEPVNPQVEIEPDYVIHSLKQSIKRSQETQTQIKILENGLDSAKGRKNDLESVISVIVIDKTIDKTIDEKNLYMDTLRAEIQGYSDEGKGYESDIKILKDRIDRISFQIQEIENMKLEAKQDLTDREQWTEIDKMLGSDKIPALELEIMLDSIDAQATRNLNPYQEGQYSFDSKTQNEKGTDKFDIIIHDSLTGETKSFLEFSPGVKAILADSYVKALLSVRSDNTYNPTILDESDGPVGPKHIREYYDIQDLYFKDYPNKKVLVVSHKTESKAYIPNYIDIKEIRSVAAAAR